MDKQSANRIIEQYFKKIYGYSIKKCFSYDEAEELCAAIGAQLWAALLKTDTLTNPDGFVWQVCEHVYSKHLRAKLKPGGDGRRYPSTKPTILFRMISVRQNSARNTTAFAWR